MNEFSKKYQLWERTEGNSFTFTEFDTLEELLKKEKYYDWYVTKKVDFIAVDKDMSFSTIPFQFDENGYLLVKPK